VLAEDAIGHFAPRFAAFNDIFDFPASFAR